MKRLILPFLAVLCVFGALAQSPSLRTSAMPILTNATTAAAGAAVRGLDVQKTYEAHGTTSAGAGAATVVVQGSNSGLSWSTLGTITLVLSTTDSSGSFTSSDRYQWLRANVTSISGTGATVSITAGY